MLLPYTYPTPKLSPHRRKAFLLSPQKTLSVWFISVLNYGDTENVLINHLLLVIPVSYPCHYTNLCPHKPHAHTHTHTHTHHTHTHTTHTHHTHTHTHTYIHLNTVFSLSHTHSPSAANGDSWWRLMSEVGVADDWSLCANQSLCPASSCGLAVRTTTQHFYSIKQIPPCPPTHTQKNCPYYIL